MPTFFNRDLAELGRQLTLSPRRLRMEQIGGIERLIGLVEAQRSYPFDFVCYHITKYRKRGAPTASSIPGKALVSDLVSLAELLSRKANLTAQELGEPFLTHTEAAARLEVSTKTIRRWRDRGLMGLRVVFDDGVNRLAFLNRTLERFAAQNRDLVQRGAAFKQLTDEERDRIVERARALSFQRPMKLHAAARVIAEETGRAVETVRYTLRRYDAAHPGSALFGGGGQGAGNERHLAMWRCRQAGESVESIAAAFNCTASYVEQVFRQVQAHEWARIKWDHVASELFDAPDADAMILDAPEPAAPEMPLARPPRDLPPYLRTLYLTPLLSREQESDLFRRYNYLKYKVARMLAAIDIDEITPSQFDQLRALIAGVDALKQRIIAANLRLVVSIAKKHVGWSPSFFEVVSDGNMSLMRAIDGFDFSRGTKFSTYATWAIVKNYARSIPEQHYHGARYVTGQSELLDAAADQRPAAASDSDRFRVRELIDAGLDELNEREREIVTNHFGLGREEGSLTLEQLGERFGVTKERIRQIEQRALVRLREVLSPSLADSLLV